MLKIVRIIPLFLVPVLALVGSGCAASQGRPRPAATASPTESGTSGSTAKRFQDTPLEGRTAVESAIELSEKYARLSDQTVALREENQRLVADNEALRQQIAALEVKLKQAQKELGEANDLLIEMLSELNNWKSDILGFRTEMREAARAQLEALLKVLEVLGGEADAAALGTRHAATLNPGSSERQESNGPTMSAGGDANEP